MNLPFDRNGSKTLRGSGGGGEKEIGELSEDVSVQSAGGGSLLTGGTEAVPIGRHSAPSVGAC